MRENSMRKIPVEKKKWITWNSDKRPTPVIRVLNR
jgi:hypothetical protein